MPTSNPRFNVTLKPNDAKLLKQFARREKKSVATVIRDLLFEGMAAQEDEALLRLAERCEKDQKGKRTYSHKEAWS